MDFNSLMKAAQKMQDDMETREKELKAKQYVSTTSRSIVQVIMNGNYEVTSIEISNDFARDFTPDDKEILQDAIMLAINELTERISADKDDAIGDLAGSLRLPGLM
ncbi:MAG: YbaB/EbfC family nucleoid-associated protein [Erysipelotrichaceae bacterium]|nr:YbaB/EbfC family nucleoid-associated protein [Erysipelotrichaceae bacterium]